MLENLMKLVFGDPNKKELKVCQGYVDKINALEPEMSGLSDARLCALSLIHISEPTRRS